MPSVLESFYKGKRVLVTGHTGFKGSWLSKWLLDMGATVAGYGLNPQGHELLFGQLGIGARFEQDRRADLSDRQALLAIVSEFQPEIVLHLAAQPLVRLSYEIPVETFATNVMGTAYLLESIRQADIQCTVVCVTTDKCYENREWLHAYREVDAMGGHDPYSASKGAAELIIASYRHSYFDDSKVRLASARAGNVIGGGDWAQDRIVPDCFRSLRAGDVIPVRNKVATRPWQHVLEPISGYLWLAACLADPGLLQGRASATQLAGPFNFGPALTSNRTVAELVVELLAHTGGDWRDASQPDALHEASKLNLATDKAFHLLTWQPTWSFEETIAYTAEWYLAEKAGKSPAALTESQISAYLSAAASKSFAWAVDSPSPII